MATTAGKAANPQLKVSQKEYLVEGNAGGSSRLTSMWFCWEQIGVCGEHGGDPSSIEFFAAVVRS